MKDNQNDPTKNENKTEQNSTMSDKFIELNAFLKINNIGNTGGQAKLIIRSGTVLVNHEPETRNKKKLHAGDIVEYEGKKIVVKKEQCLMTRKEKDKQEE
jgi:ribosome-associated protein